MFAVLEGTPLERHGRQHANLLLAYLDGLFGAAPRTNPLNPTEALILSAATMLHNIGLCFPRLSDSVTLQNAYPSAWQDDLPEAERLALFNRHWHELSAEMILGSINAPFKYPDLGLNPDDPVDLIAALIRALPLRAEPRIPDASFQGTGVRMDLLVNLVRLAGDLDVAAQVDAPPAGKQTDWSSAYQLDYWLRYYMEAVRITRGSVQLFCCVPDEEYVPLITNAFYGFYLKRWMETAAPLLSAGWTILFLPPQIERPTETVKARKLPMPADLLAILRDPQRLAEELGTAREILSDHGQAPPDIYPYYFGAIPNLDEFHWELTTNPDYEYSITLYDQDSGERLWRRSGLKQNHLIYPADAPPLETGRRYRWTVDPSLKGYPAPGAGGIFWLLPGNSQAALDEAEDRLVGDSRGDQLLAAGLLEMSFACYGQASHTLQQAVLQATEVAIPARRALLELYDALAQELARLGKSRDAKTFMRLAEYQANKLQQTLSVPSDA
jgi:hypothetical protein